MKIIEKKNEVRVQGKYLQLRFTIIGRGVCVDIYARKGRRWILVSGSERTTVSVHPRTEVRGPVLETGKRVIEFKQEIMEISESGDIAEVILSGKAGPHSALQKFSIQESDRHVNIRTEIDLGGPVRISSLGTPYLFVPDGMLYSQYSLLDFCWIPTLRRKPEHVVGDQVFRSPAAVMQTGGIMAAIVPDLDVLSENRTLPTALDLRLENPGPDAPTFWYGFCPYRVDGHVYFQHSPSGFEPVKGTLVYAHDIIAAADAPDAHAHRLVGEHLWHRYGKILLNEIDPQVLPFEEYADRAYKFVFNSGKVWRSFESEGNDVAGTIVQTFSGASGAKIMNNRETLTSLKLSKLIPKVHGTATEKLMSRVMVNDIVQWAAQKLPLSVPPLIMFQSWFNNLRTAFGMYSYGLELDDGTLADNALKMKELALNAPSEKGLLRALCYCPEDADPFWIQGTKGFEPVREYHLPDNAWTACWMLRWYEELEEDARLLEKAKAVGDAFIEFQMESGSIPGWVRIRKSGPIASSALLQSAETAAPGMLLARLAKIDGSRKYTKAAERAAGFLIENVFPDNKWWDYETFFSCSKKEIGMVDEGTGMQSMNNLSIFWATEMMRELAVITGNSIYMDYGLRALDLLLLWQQVWNAPYISINTFGGFGVMNTDAEWNDARQSMFAESLMSWYEVTGNEEYFERGIAALRASFTTMLVPENKTTAPGNMQMYEPIDEGATYENYAHLGFDRRAPGYLMFDWGSGGACTSAASIRRKYGDVYADAAREHAFGINLLSVESVSFNQRSVSMKVKSGILDSRNFRLRITGMKAGKYSIVINNAKKGVFSSSELDRGMDIDL